MRVRVVALALISTLAFSLATSAFATSSRATPFSGASGMARILGRAPLVDERRTLAGDHALRIRVVHASTFKYPLLRVEDTLASADIATPDPVPLKTRIFVADHVLVKVRDGVTASDAIAKIAAVCLPRQTEAAVLTHFLPSMGTWLQVAFDGTSVESQTDVLTQLQTLSDVVEVAEADGVVGW